MKKRTKFSVSLLLANILVFIAATAALAGTAPKLLMIYEPERPEALR